MLDYLSDLMEDAQDFGWASAKGTHALILCRMEEGKVDWLSSDKLDLLRAHTKKYSIQAMFKVKKIRMTSRVWYVSTFSLGNVVTNLTILQIVNFTNIVVLIATVWEKNLPMHLKIAEISVNRTQKTSKALQCLKNLMVCMIITKLHSNLHK